MRSSSAGFTYCRSFRENNRFRLSFHDFISYHISRKP
jgi:hypothetical protein